jgi:hypothetical protein
VNIPNFLTTSDNSFTGFFSITSVPDTTHFVYQTYASGSTSAIGGTFYWYRCNYITWSPVTGAFRYIVYTDRGTPGTFNILGVSRAVNPGFPNSYKEGNFAIEDYGSPMMDNFTMYPWYVPATAPSTATHDLLVTTITNISGTTITLGANAGNTTTSSNIVLDTTPIVRNILSTNGGGRYPLYFPLGGGFAFNSVLDMGAVAGSTSWIGGGQAFYDTLIWRWPHWSGITPARSSQSDTAFEWESYPIVTCNVAPCVFVREAATGRIEGLNFQLGEGGTGNPNTVNGNQALILLSDGGGGGTRVTYSQINFAMGSGNDYMNMAMEFRGSPNTDPYAQSDGSGNFREITTDSGPGGQGQGRTTTPAAFFQAAGHVQIESLFMAWRGWAFRPSQPYSRLHVGYSYIQGGLIPSFTILGNTGNDYDYNGPSSMQVYLDAMNQDTATSPFIAELNSTWTTTANLMAATPWIAGINGPFATGSQFGEVHGVYAGPQTMTGARFGNNLLGVNGAGAINIDLPGGGTATLAKVSGGSVPAGTYTEQIAWVDAFGREGGLSYAASITITAADVTAGNQTIQVTPPAAPAGLGVVGYTIYRNGIKTGTGSNQCPTVTLGTPFNDTLGYGNPCGIGAPLTPGGSSVYLGPTGMEAPSYRSAAAGFATVAAAATAVTVSNAAVTADSQILVTEDSSLGTKLGVTCNTTTGRTYSVTARTAGTSFVITSSAAPTTNPACLSYSIVN